MRFELVGLGVLGLGLGSPAAADWYEVRTKHVLLSIDASEQEARDFGSRLERFDAALRRLYGIADSPDRHGRPIHVYALKPELFQRVCNCSYALGYYRPQTYSPLIFSMYMPSTDRKAKTGGWSTQTVLLHEYAHHFAFANIPIAYPSWYSEGFAEFNANASFEADGSIIIGYPANYRGAALKSSDRLSARKLFEPQRYGAGDPDLFYGRGWLLTHYLTLNRHRKGQLAAYLSAVNEGKSSLDAAEAAFGDLKQLNSELDRYARGQIAPPLRVPAEPPPRVSVRLLPPGQAEMMPTHAMVQSGVPKAYRGGIARRAGRIAQKYPTDPVLQMQWAEAAIMAGRLDEADRAVDIALRLTPDSSEAFLRKGVIAFRRASDAKVPNSALWAQARQWLSKANRADPNAVLPLYLYYQSFIKAQQAPTPAAVKGLMRAHVIAPESKEVRVALAQQTLISGDPKEARVLLQPIAFAPHAPKADNAALKVIELIDAGRIEDAKAAFREEKEEDE